MKLKGKHVEVTPLLLKAGIACKSVAIIETPGMYPNKERIEDNWAYFTAIGCQELKKRFALEGKVVSKICIVGICSGVEGIAVSLIFRDELKELIVTDIDEEILQGTCFNLESVTSPYGITVLPLVGSFCEPIADKSIKVHLVHANIPNLPANDAMDLTKGAEKGTFLPADLYEKYNPPEKYVAWALGAQWAYLQSAKEVVEVQGSVVTELGGRVPSSIVKDLFRDLELDFSEILVGYKEQTEAMIDFQGYHAFEKQFGVEFDFYRHEASLEVLAKHDLLRPSSIVSIDEIKDLLLPYRISAGKALDLYHEGVTVGHTVHIFRGVRLS